MLVLCFYSGKNYLYNKNRTKADTGGLVIIYVDDEIMILKELGKLTL